MPRRAQKPLTSKPLDISLLVTSTTHERVRTLTPNGDGTCTETFKDCDKTDASTKSDTLGAQKRTNYALRMRSLDDWLTLR